MVSVLHLKISLKISVEFVTATFHKECTDYFPVVLYFGGYDTCVVLQALLAHYAALR